MIEDLLHAWKSVPLEKVGVAVAYTEPLAESICFTQNEEEERKWSSQFEDIAALDGHLMQVSGGGTLGGPNVRFNQVGPLNASTVFFMYGKDESRVELELLRIPHRPERYYGPGGRTWLGSTSMHPAIDTVKELEELLKGNQWDDAAMMVVSRFSQPISKVRVPVPWEHSNYSSGRLTVRLDSRTALISDVDYSVPLSVKWSNAGGNTRDPHNG
jgi:hypothetical protein